jgi:hypothetical protein
MYLIYKRIVVFQLYIRQSISWDKKIRDITARPINLASHIYPDYKKDLYQYYLEHSM